MFLNVMSIAKTTIAKIKEATITTMAEFCNWDQVGQVTFFANSMYDSLKYKVILFIFFLIVTTTIGSFVIIRLNRSNRNV